MCRKGSAEAWLVDAPLAIRNMEISVANKSLARILSIVIVTEGHSICSMKLTVSVRTSCTSFKVTCKLQYEGKSECPLNLRINNDRKDVSRNDAIMGGSVVEWVRAPDLKSGGPEFKSRFGR